MATLGEGVVMVASHSYIFRQETMEKEAIYLDSHGPLTQMELEGVVQGIALVSSVSFASVSFASLLGDLC